MVRVRYTVPSGFQTLRDKADPRLTDSSGYAKELKVTEKAGEKHVTIVKLKIQLFFSIIFLVMLEDRG